MVVNRYSIDREKEISINETAYLKYEIDYIKKIGISQIIYNIEIQYIKNR